MKKMGHFIQNIYRISVFKSRSDKSRRMVYMDCEGFKDTLIRSTIANDPDPVEPDAELLDILCERVAGRKNRVRENSFFILPVFLFKNLELKMVIISLVTVISLGINPGGRYQSERKLSPFSLADTLIDSSGFERPVYHWINEKN